MLLIAGLGNPGQQYAGHRHNVGFMAADAIFRRHSFAPWSKKFSALVSEGRLGGEKVLLIKPQTYMNLSGQAVGEAMRFYKLTPADLIVFYDELDLAPGRLRVKTGGGSGGHNGIKSIDAHCGKDYRRVRIGIGHPGDKARVNGHVLGDFAKADQAWLEPLLDAIADNAGLLAGGDESGFMNRVSLAVKGTGAGEATAPAGKPGKQQSHIRQARQKGPAAPLPESGPMAAMLKKLFGQKD
ncbi:aminoacyl-tRNA hydrolase [Nitratireductor sp. ZSWI3]|uniref:aminoacyl-tRNA hydrolase n=1 Tax=Nitratireductor sp. ZSWI3 TaxID=2966359 RepID=UPI00214FA893|nr:aminoacyl-tRNA hydrolase [Nitratireductor sp. ZSWI3]MCR4265758.1 aminoacyl-tRNA hydrolase [Nitratireductor sp. ZSWI3]